MQIVSYNVNGIRAAARKGLAEWLGENNFDIVCLQESKANLEQVDMADFEALGYQHHWHSAEKKGYSGVVTMTRHQPDQVVVGKILGERQSGLSGIGGAQQGSCADDDGGQRGREAVHGVNPVRGLLMS